MGMIERLLLLALLVCCGVIVQPFRANAAEDEGNATDWYIDAGVSAYVIDLPEYAPLWDLDTTTLTNSERVTLVDDPVVAPLFHATLGRRLADQWFVEARGEYADIETQENGAYTHSPSRDRVGYYSLSGTKSLLGTVGTAFTKTDVTFQEYGLDLLAGKTFTLAEAQVRLFGGYWFTGMDVDYDLDYRSSTGDHMLLHESLGTTYNGALVGLGLESRHGAWKLAVETTHGVALAHTDYHGAQKNIVWSDSRRLNRDECTYRGTLAATLSRPVGSGWDLALTSEVRYLSYVPQIVASGKTSTPGFSSTGTPTQLKSADSFSGKLGLELSHSF